MKRVINIVTNKYFLAITTFIIWMLFFDQRDFFSTQEQKKKLHSLEKKKQYYTQEIDKAKTELTDLQSNPDALEKFAREKYLMKKEGEDIFVIEDSTEDKK